MNIIKRKRIFTVGTHMNITWRKSHGSIGTMCQWRMQNRGASLWKAMCPIPHHGSTINQFVPPSVGVLIVICFSGGTWGIVMDKQWRGIVEDWGVIERSLWCLYSWFVRLWNEPMWINFVSAAQIYRFWMHHTESRTFINSSAFDKIQDRSIKFNKASARSWTLKFKETSWSLENVYLNTSSRTVQACHTRTRRDICSCIR